MCVYVCATGTVIASFRTLIFPMLSGRRLVYQALVDRVGRGHQVIKGLTRRRQAMRLGQLANHKWNTVSLVFTAGLHEVTCVSVSVNEPTS